MEIFKVICMIAGLIFITMIGLLHAYFPINDRETSTSHRVFTFFLMAVAAITWIGLIK